MKPPRAQSNNDQHQFQTPDPQEGPHDAAGAQTGSVPPLQLKIQIQIMFRYKYRSGITPCSSSEQRGFSKEAGKKKRERERGKNRREFYLCPFAADWNRLQQSQGVPQHPFILGAALHTWLMIHGLDPFPVAPAAPFWALEWCIWSHSFHLKVKARGGRIL